MRSELIVTICRIIFLKVMGSVAWIRAFNYGAKSLNFQVKLLQDETFCMLRCGFAVSIYVCESDLFY